MIGNFKRSLDKSVPATVRHLGHFGHIWDMSTFEAQSITVSYYVLNLLKEAKERYRSKLIALQCTMNPYIDKFNYMSVQLPPVTYADIYNFFMNSSSFL